MPHFLVVAALVLAAWALLSLPLGVLVGRRLKRVDSRALPAGCAFRATARTAAPTGPLTGPPTGPAVAGALGTQPAESEGVPGCAAKPCRARPVPVAGGTSCAKPRAGHRWFGGATG